MASPHDVLENGFILGIIGIIRNANELAKEARNHITRQWKCSEDQISVSVKKCKVYFSWNEEMPLHISTQTAKDLVALGFKERKETES